MRIEVRLPSGEVVTLDGVAPRIETLKQRIEAATTIPVPCQELWFGGSPLEFLPEREKLDVDLVVRVGRDYAIASASLPPLPLPGTETFRPARSIERTRDFDSFRAVSHRCRFSDNRPLEKTADTTRAEARANARLEPYRARADARRARLKDLCASLGESALLAMTFNAPYASLFENWDRSCSRHGIDGRSCAVVFPMDAQAESAARRLGYATFFDPGSYGQYEQSAAVRFADRQWIDCLFMKSAVMGDMLATGFDVLFQDVDVVWRRDPIPYLRAKANLECWDFMFQKAALNLVFQPLHYNTGFVYARSNEFSRLTWERILDNQRYCYVYRSQQAPVNIVMNAFRERGLRTCALDEDLFVNGHRIPVKPKRDAGELHPQAFVIHFNWTDGLVPKVDRLRDNGFWYLDRPATASPGKEERMPATRPRNQHRDHAPCFISHRLRCLYLPIAKNASSTIKAELQRLDEQTKAERCTCIPAEAWRDYTTFAFLRDPVARALSAYQEISLRMEVGEAESLPFAELAAGLERFDAFLDWIETNPRDDHVIRQVDLIGDHRIDFFGRVETFQDDFAKLLGRLGVAPGPRFPMRRSRLGRARDYGYAKHMISEEDLGPTLVRRVREIYAEDLQLLDELWPADPQPRSASTRWTLPVVRRL